MISVADWAIIFATLMGPVLAVQAQKWIERRQERSARQLWVFRTLMATRASNLSQIHVEALNAIPIDFFQKGRRNKKVVDEWKIYLDHLTNGNPAGSAWGIRRVELFNNLLHSISDSVGYSFSKLEIQREVYSPNGHATIEDEQTAIRSGMAAVMRGEKAFPIELRSPISPVEAAFIVPRADTRRS